MNEEFELLRKTSWASKRTEESSNQAFSRSVCVKFTENGKLIGLIRAITDQVTITYICDMVVDEAHRNSGVGTAMINKLLNHPDLKSTTFVVISGEAGEFYEKSGFTMRECWIRRPE